MKRLREPPTNYDNPWKGNDIIRVEGLQLARGYKDGSYTTEDPVLDQPQELAEWGFLAIHQKEDRIIHQKCNHVHLDPAKASFHETILRNNNKGEVIATDPATAPPPRTQLRNVFGQLLRN